MRYRVIRMMIFEMIGIPADMTQTEVAMMLKNAGMVRWIFFDLSVFGIPVWAMMENAV